MRGVLFGDDAACDDGNMAQTGLFHLAHQLFDQRDVGARQDRKPDHMGVIGLCGGDDLGGGEADAFIGDVHATVAGAGRDLFRAVGMAVEAGFAHKELELAPQSGGDAGDFFADVFQPFGAVRGVGGDAGGAAILAEGGTHHIAPFTGRRPRFRGFDRGGHDIGAAGSGFAQLLESGLHSGFVPAFAPCLEPRDLVGFGLGVGFHDAAIACGERGGLARGPFIDPDDNGFASFDLGNTFCIGLHEARFHVFDRFNRPAHTVERVQLGACALFERGDLALHGGVLVEQVVIFEQIGLIGEDLLHAQRPLLIEGAGQAERFVPCRKLHGAGAGVLGQGHGEHLDQDAVDVVLRLLFGQAEGVDLHPVAETAEFRVGDAVAFAGDLVPQFDEGTHLAHLGDEADTCVHKERNPPDHRGKGLGRHFAFQVVQHGNGGGQREGQFLLRRRAGLLQVVGTDVHRVPFRQVFARIGGHIRNHPQAGARRADIGAAREVFLDDVVLHRALQLGDIRALFLGHGDIERQQPRGRGVDRHGGVHLFERDVVKEHPHVAQMADRNADLADLALRQFVIAVIAGLGGQVEGDREAGLPLGKIGAIERVGGLGGRVARIGPEEPRAVFAGPVSGCTVRAGAVIGDPGCILTHCAPPKIALQQYFSKSVMRGILCLCQFAALRQGRKIQ